MQMGLTTTSVKFHVKLLKKKKKKKKKKTTMSLFMMTKETGQTQRSLMIRHKYVAEPLSKALKLDCQIATIQKGVHHLFMLHIS